MPQPLRHGPTVYNGHLRGPVTLTPVAERLAVELFYDCRLQSLRSVSTGNRTLISHRRGKRSTSTSSRRSESLIKISYNLVVRENALYSLGLTMLLQSSGRRICSCRTAVNTSRPPSVFSCWMALCTAINSPQREPPSLQQKKPNTVKHL